MSRFTDVQDFVRKANRVTEFSELQGLMEVTVKNLGFDCFALINHVSTRQEEEPAVRLMDFPEAWIDLIKERNYFYDDPVLVACQKSVAPFTWDDVPQIVPLTSRQREVLDAARLSGLGSGFIVPIHIPGESLASCTFSMRTGRDIPTQSFPAAQYVSCFAFEAARRVAQRMASKKKGRRSDEGSAPARLTRRQLDCVVLAGRGKSDRDIADILAIRSNTVHSHMEDAKRKYGVATRMQLIVRVLFDNHVAFADLLHH